MFQAALNYQNKMKYIFNNVACIADLNKDIPTT